MSVMCYCAVVVVVIVFGVDAAVASVAFPELNNSRHLGGRMRPDSPGQNACAENPFLLMGTNKIPFFVMFPNPLADSNASNFERVVFHPML